MLKKILVVAKVCKRGFWLQTEISRAIAKKTSLSGRLPLEQNCRASL
jgi:hypothetical protein